MSDKILAALALMDPTVDAHWTMNGDAKLETVKALADGESITREELEALAPGFNREAVRAYRAGQIQGATDGPQATTGNGTGAVIEPIQPEQGEVESGPTDRTSEIEALAEEISSQDKAILKLERFQDEIRKELADAYEKLQSLRARQIKLTPEVTNTANIQLYLESQKAILATRGRARAAVAANGVNLDAVMEAIGPSPLDQAMKNRPRGR